MHGHLKEKAYCLKLGKMRKCIFNGKVQGKKFAHIICIHGDTDYVVPTPAQWVAC